MRFLQRRCGFHRGNAERVSSHRSRHRKHHDLRCSDQGGRSRERRGDTRGDTATRSGRCHAHRAIGTHRRRRGNHSWDRVLAVGISEPGDGRRTPGSRHIGHGHAHRLYRPESRLPSSERGRARGFEFGGERLAECRRHTPCGGSVGVWCERIPLHTCGRWMSSSSGQCQWRGVPARRDLHVGSAVFAHSRLAFRNSRRPERRRHITHEGPVGLGS